MEIIQVSKSLFNFGKTMIERMVKKTLASNKLPAKDELISLVQNLHPSYLLLVLIEIIEETPTTKTFRFKVAPDYNGRIPYFRAGQYISIKTQIGDSIITRPYSISSAPSDGWKDNSKSCYLDITIKKNEEGFFTPYIWEHWKIGAVVKATGPHGTFYHQPIRDTNEIIAIAGGSGITPFRSMIREIIEQNLDIKLIVIYGSRDCSDIIFEQELNDYQDKYPDKIKVVNVISEPDKKWKGLCGFISADIIKENVDNLDKTSFFICGPPALYDYVKEELAKLKIPSNRIRKELYGGQVDIKSLKDFPKKAIGKTFAIKVFSGNKEMEVSAKSNETVLVAMERAGIVVPSQCRAGVCGVCRSELLDGDIYISGETDGRRAADIEFGFFHPCSSYPVSDLTVKIPVSDAVII